MKNDSSSYTSVPEMPIDEGSRSTWHSGDDLLKWIEMYQARESLKPEEQAQLTRYKLELLRLEPGAEVTLLEEHHNQTLKASAIVDATIRSRQYRTIHTKNELVELGFDPFVVYRRSQCYICVSAG